MPSDSVAAAATLWPVALTAGVESAARVPAVVATSELPAVGSPAAMISSVSTLPASPDETASMATATGSSSSSTVAVAKPKRGAPGALR
ncbi:hypothetical protein GUJ93_ZPchr0011g28495 [Zizania palustris]|uniref:Uncharacterized protein n=1 Tax=Zizania palustris TaxID=103762 RepID=A0A8J5WID7_ZIZPA|nr:hypothetical protein GUJ93_ZPchr0011g28495 [Zizania palustris]